MKAVPENLSLQLGFPPWSSGEETYLETTEISRITSRIRDSVAAHCPWYILCGL